MSYGIYKQTYAGREAYRYRITDVKEQVRYLAEPTGLCLPNPTRLVTLFDPDHEPVGRIEPPSTSAWQMGGEYALLLRDEEQPLAMIDQRWTLVDLILLQLPSYLIRLGEYRYVARGSRYGERLYEIFPHSGERQEDTDEPKVGDEAAMRMALEKTAVPRRGGESAGEIVCPARGPNYIVQAQAPPLRQALLTLAALVIVVDMNLQGYPV
jgi:hypothetical protein